MILRSAVPLLNDLGVEADWKLISGDDDFFHVTKTLHDALQGAERMLTSEEQQTYDRTAERNARAFEGEYDYVVVHDPQPAGVLRYHGRGAARWV